ncbi:hypothetical protein BN1723_016416 [Verticillium longisporum]|uniref:Uncharacterized protein n=1 Tax=Verticillium longisporum TaxID=100787 RepID=A0A0G4NEY9_VERLO|nr:hypothetical protein BN1723_016416 [Verticillium longisporum]
MASLSQFSPEQELQGEEDWENLSSEGDLLRQMGWVVYSCSCAKEFDAAREDLKRRIRHRLSASNAETMDSVFVEDPALEDATVVELRRRFQARARQDAGEAYNMDRRLGSRDARHEFFPGVDGEAPWNGNVGLVGAGTSAVCPEVYAQLEHPEAWYAYYRPPENGVYTGW